MQWVASYDARSVDHMYKLETKIDRFYQTLKYTPVARRGYADFRDRYFDIDVEIRALLRQQQRRANNQETVQQVTILAQLWAQDKQQHQQQNRLSDFVVERRIKQYQRLFDALIAGENAKKNAQE
ncbi:hypothetical protein HGP28_03510 [Vibrio sp. SM6]|uniref:Uncharacterized protein n=1 Tax=Vibrio agarilyticus TaxID=2726741 RepID=A0A7X8TNV8_9VIBR|nr:hypothetical protein [Vibrio agarilyticus]NLS11957.1 hypothetical protein [Vibrio agarilyticus]